MMSQCVFGKIKLFLFTCTEFFYCCFQKHLPNYVSLQNPAMYTFNNYLNAVYFNTWSINTFNFYCLNVSLTIQDQRRNISLLAGIRLQFPEHTVCILQSWLPRTTAHSHQRHTLSHSLFSDYWTSLGLIVYYHVLCMCCLLYSPDHCLIPYLDFALCIDFICKLQ